MSTPDAQLIDDQTWVVVETLMEELELARRSSVSTQDVSAAALGSKGRRRSPADSAFPSGSVDELKCMFELDDADVQILTFALAPMMRPRIGWLYREHQPGDAAGFPGIDLICESLQLLPGQVVDYRNRLVPGAPLMRGGLVEQNRLLPYAPIFPTPRACQNVLRLAPEGNEILGATMMSPAEGLDALICAEYLSQQLTQLSAWAAGDRSVKQWDIPVEHGLVILFSGPSGTGKTMAARALATQIGKPLYRVDMGLLVSKYIGETPKNINKLFEHAARVDAILLFDEADGLFGKRGEVNDARDRYANMEVGHLLARMEQHQGICLLTSNLKEQIDSAFLRRIDVMLQFNPPTQEERVVLWNRYLGGILSPALTLKRANGAFELDPSQNEVSVQRARAKLSLLRRLGGELHLSGAQIANACRYAARRLAIVQPPAVGAVVPPRPTPSQKDLLGSLAHGVWNELRKSNGGAHLSALGFLKEHLAEHVQ